MDTLPQQGFRLLVMLMMLASSGCQIIPLKLPPPPGMSPPQSLKNVPPLPVRTAGPLWLNGLMTVGPWKMQDVSVGHQNHRCSQHWLSVDSIDSRSYALTVPTKDRVLRAACEMKRGGRFYRMSDEPAPGSGYSQFECKIHGSDEGQLQLLTQSTGTKHGTVTFGAQQWDVHSVHLDDHDVVSTMPVGYEIWNGDTVIAAVETISDDGRIWIEPSLSEEDQHRVVVATGALLLYRAPAYDPLYTCQ